MDKENEKKQSKTVTILVAIIVILGFALGFVLGTKINDKSDKKEDNTVKETESKKEEDKKPEEKKELSEKDAADLLDFYGINASTIKNYTINNKLEVTYNYLLKQNKDKYKEETCKDFLKGEISNWKHESYQGHESYELFKNTDNYYYCSGEGKYYVIPYSDYVDALKKLFDEEMKKDFWEFYYVKDLDSIVFLPYRDGTEGPSVVIDKIKSVKEENDVIEIEYYTEKVACDDYNYSKETYKNCGKNNFKVSGSAKEVEQEIVDKHLSDIDLYKITFVDHGDYKTFKSIEK